MFSRRKNNTLMYSLVLMCVFLPQTIFSQSVESNAAYDQLNAFAGQRGADLGQAVDPRSAIASYAQTLLEASAVICILLIVYSGFMLFIARGDESRVETAKKTLRQTVIGLIIILSAYSITIAVSRIVDSSTKGKDYTNNQQRVRVLDGGDVYNLFD